MIIPTSFFSSIIVTPTEFDANSIVGLEIWLKGNTSVFSDAGTTPAVNLDPVYQWNDLSGNVRHAIQASAGSRPQFKTNNLNGKPTIKCDGVDDILIATGAWGLFPSVPHTYFFVMNVYGGTYLLSAAATGGPGFGEISHGGQFTLNSGNNNIRYTHGTLPEGFKVYTLITGTSGNIKLNNVSQASGDTGAANFANGLAIGGVNAFRSEIDFAEVIGYNSALSAGDQTLVVNYLMTKYGL